LPPIRPHGSLGRGAHQRILEAAAALFTRRGINATPMNDLYIAARVSKRTLYQHFPSKDALVLEYLDTAERARGSGPEAILGRTDLAPRARLLELFTTLADQPRPMRPDPFVGAAVEFPDPDHPAHRAAADHGRRFVRRLADLARDAGARDPEQVGRRLALLYDGAAVRAYAIAAAILRDAID